MLVMLAKIILELVSKFKIGRVGRTVRVKPESALRKRGLVLGSNLGSHGHFGLSFCLIPIRI